MQINAIKALVVLLRGSPAPVPAKVVALCASWSVVCGAKQYDQHLFVAWRQFSQCRQELQLCTGSALVNSSLQAPSRRRCSEENDLSTPVMHSLDQVHASNPIARSLPVDGRRTAQLLILLISCSLLTCNVATPIGAG